MAAASPFRLWACCCPPAAGVVPFRPLCGLPWRSGGFPPPSSATPLADRLTPFPLIGPDLRHSPALLAAGQKSMTRHRLRLHSRQGKQHMTDIPLATILRINAARNIPLDR